MMRLKLEFLQVLSECPRVWTNFDPDSVSATRTKILNAIANDGKLEVRCISEWTQDGSDTVVRMEVERTGAMPMNHITMIAEKEFPPEWYTPDKKLRDRVTFTDETKAIRLTAPGEELLEHLFHGGPAPTGKPVAHWSITGRPKIIRPGANVGEPSADTQKFSEAVKSVACPLTQELLWARWNGIQNGTGVAQVLAEFRQKNSKRLGKNEAERQAKWANISKRARTVIKPFVPNE